MGLPVVFYKGYFLKNFGKKDLRNLENEQNFNAACKSWAIFAKYSILDL